MINFVYKLDYKLLLVFNFITILSFEILRNSRKTRGGKKYITYYTVNPAFLRIVFRKEIRTLLLN